MQALAVRSDQEQASLTAQQSLQSVQTLLKASLGCITYLRNLLPSENFSTSYLTSSGPASLSSQPSMNTGSFVSDGGRRNVSGFKIMTVTRGFTEEADKLLDYMENGIFDALQKQYLRSFILAIFLDNDDPNNIVEAYTFNFDYHQIPGTDVTVPVMTLDADLERLSLHGRKKAFDPTADATKQGRVPTLGEVKRSLKVHSIIPYYSRHLTGKIVQSLIKNLIQATTQMDALPKRRFATFKLFYNDNTPDDYEPTHFHAGDAKKDRWFFTTHDRSEVPEKCKIGSLQTGHHGVNVHIASVSAHLPSTEDNNAPFLGTTAGHMHTGPVLTPAEEAAVRLQQMEMQRRDAMERHIVWDADSGLCDADADGEKDPDYATGSCRDGRTADDSGVEFFDPIGIRDEAGKIKQFSGTAASQNVTGSEVRYAGRVDSVPNQIAQLAEGAKQSDELQRTQQLEETQVINSPAVSPSSLTSSPSPAPSPTPQPRNRGRNNRRVQSFNSSLPPSDLLPESMESGSPIIHEPGSLDTQSVKDLIINVCTTGEDTEMLELDTQIVPASVDSIQSFTSADDKEAPAAKNDAKLEECKDVVECECGVAVEDCDCIRCEGECKKWFHAWCMGFHSAKDKRVPAHFLCFDCRVRADQNWELIVLHDLYPRMMERFKDLAIFRRAIKVFETRKPDCLSAFTKLIACDSAVAGQVFKRLETEGFIALHGEPLDAESVKGGNTGKKGKGRQPRRKTMRKPRYVFVSALTQGQAYRGYFDPDPEVEKKVLGLSDLVRDSKAFQLSSNDEVCQKPRRRSHRKRVVEDIEMNVPDNTATLANTAPSMGQPISGLGENEADPGSQTQQETQLIGSLSPDGTENQTTTGQLKRKISKTPNQLQTRPSKKVKISLGSAVDLGD
ncbi:HORMA-domain-containing protein [Daedalea quercina L-15889]|uniref:HORMA-domain-containing protein n=1 Tax=Daedalea quercina L-15889 TaxID=1314783 RepID=A0A165RXA4_9APHY|nr:HORMA-domain-containing protein [Daedalea quercina L-15889]